MIQQSQIKTASFDVRRKAKACEVHEVNQTTVYVLPHDETKNRRAVIWLPNGILCVSVDGVECEANGFKNVCYHAFAANRRREINAKRRRTLAMKREAA